MLARCDDCILYVDGVWMFSMVPHAPFSPRTVHRMLLHHLDVMYSRSGMLIVYAVLSMRLAVCGGLFTKSPPNTDLPIMEFILGVRR